MLQAGLLLALGVLPAFTAIEDGRTHISLSLSPRPSEGTARKDDLLFDHKASLKIKLNNVVEAAPEVKVQWVILYDDVESSGKIKREHVADTASLSMERGEEKTIESKVVRLTGKISKKGILTGMRYIGYCVRIYDGGKLVAEEYQPQDIKKELSEIYPPLAEKKLVAKPAAVTAAAPDPSEITPKPAPAPTPPTESKAVAAPSADGDVTLCESTFTKEEAAAALKLANELSEDDLILKVGLARQAAHNLTLKRPFQNIEELPKVSYVKKTAMAAFKKYVEKK